MGHHDAQMLLFSNGYALDPPLQTARLRDYFQLGSTSQDIHPYFRFICNIHKMNKLYSWCE